MKKQRQKGVEGVKGHIWKPEWLGQHSWLRTVPDKTQDEWEVTPTEGPEAMYCICCAFYSFGHNDVMAKKKKEAIRGDKIGPHLHIGLLPVRAVRENLTRVT